MKRMIIVMGVQFREHYYTKGTVYYLSPSATKDAPGWSENKDKAIQFDIPTGTAVLNALQTVAKKVTGELTDRILFVSEYVDQEPSDVVGTAASEFGRLGGMASSEAKRLAAQVNGKKGGRPRKAKPPEPMTE